MLCRHCQSAPVEHTRGLCLGCTAQPAVFERYKPRNDGGRKNEAHGYQPVDLAYVPEGLSLGEKIDAVFEHWWNWQADYEVERMLRTDLMAVALRGLGEVTLAARRVSEEIDGRR